VFREFSTRWKPLCFIVVGKAFIYPAIVIALAMVLGVNGDALIVLVIMSLAPTATASFPAVQQLGGDAALAADAVAITTVLSLPLYLVVISML
jgi:predicted permease